MNRDFNIFLKYQQNIKFLTNIKKDKKKKHIY